jgi:hypothetical protein
MRVRVDLAHKNLIINSRHQRQLCSFLLNPAVIRSQQVSSLSVTCPATCPVCWLKESFFPVLYVDGWVGPYDLLVWCVWIGIKWNTAAHISLILKKSRLQKTTTKITPWRRHHHPHRLSELCAEQKYFFLKKKKKKNFPESRSMNPGQWPRKRVNRRTKKTKEEQEQKK